MLFKKYISLLISTTIFAQSISSAFAMEGHLEKTGIAISKTDIISDKKKEEARKICQSSACIPSQDTPQFPNQLTDFTYSHFIWGGSGGVHVLKDATGQLFTFKTATHSEQMKEEILADALYHSLGIRVPAFAVYNHLPHNISEIRDPGPGPYRLAQFIEKHETASKKTIAKVMQNYFVADALFSNFDIVIGDFKNVIFDTANSLWRIDNGGALRFQACGGSKYGLNNWHPFEVHELETMRQTTDGSFVYGSLSETELKKQVEEIAAKSHNLFSTLDEMAQKLCLTNPAEVREMLRLRLEYLVNKYLLTPSTLQVMDGFIAPQFGAGILPYSIAPNGQKVILLGKRINHNWWCNFGRRGNLNKKLAPGKTLVDIAAREVQEESLGYLSFTSQELANSPSHDILSSDDAFYRMYMAYTPYVEIERLKRAKEVPNYGWISEYAEYRWIPLGQFLQGLNKKSTVREEEKETVQIDDIILYPYFWEMLQETPIINTLQSILDGKKVRAKHTHNGKVQRVVPLLSVAHEKQQLATIVVKKSFLLGQIKTHNQPRFTPISPLVGDETDHHEEIQKMPGFLNNSEAQQLKQSLKDAAYTQTQAYLYHRMGKAVLGSLLDQSSQEVNKFLGQYSYFKNLEFSDEHFRKTLISALDQEKANREAMVFYHASDPLTCFLWDIFTAYRTCLKNFGANKITTLRGLEKNFASIADVEAFIKKFESYNGNIDNYTMVDGVHYADLGLSVNPFLFGNDGNELSATYYLFYQTKSVRPIEQEQLFNAFMAATGIPGEFKDYLALFQQYYTHDNEWNSKLFQIFVAPQIVDCVAYTAVAGGNIFSVTMDEKPYHGFAKSMGGLRANPETGIVNIQNGKSKNSNIKSNNMNELQGRVFLTPKIFLEQRYVWIKEFWRFPVSVHMEESYYGKLYGQVSQDLSFWLAQHNYLDSSTFIEDSPALKRSYKLAYANRMGLPYREQEPKTKLLSAIRDGDSELIKKILEKHQDVNINAPFPNTNYRNIVTITLWPLEVLSLTTPNFSEIIKIFVENGLNSISNIQVPEELMYKIINEILHHKDKLNNDLLLNIKDKIKSETIDIYTIEKFFKEKYLNLLSYIFNEVKKINIPFISLDNLHYLVYLLKANTTLESLDISKERILSFITLLSHQEDQKYKKAPWFQKANKEYLSASPNEIIHSLAQDQLWDYIPDFIVKIIENPEIETLNLAQLPSMLGDQKKKWNQTLLESLKVNSTLQDLFLPEEQMQAVMVALMSSSEGPYQKAPWFIKEKAKLFESIKDPVKSQKLFQCALNNESWDFIVKIIENPEIETLNLAQLPSMWGDQKKKWNQTLLKSLKVNSTLQDLFLPEEQMQAVMVALMSSSEGPYQKAPWFIKEKAKLFESIKDPVKSQKLFQYALNNESWDFIVKIIENPEIETLNLAQLPSMWGDQKKKWNQTLLEGLKSNNTLAELSLRREEMLDFMGHLMKDTKDAFWSAPWFKLAEKEILKDYFIADNIHLAAQQGYRELILKLMQDTKVESLNLVSASNYNNDHEVDLILEGLTHNKSIRKLIVGYKYLRDTKTMEKLAEFIKTNRNLKCLDLVCTSLNNEVARILIETLKADISLEDLILTQPLRLEILDQLLPHQQELSGGMRQWFEKSIQEQLSTSQIGETLAGCENNGLRKLINYILNNLIELKFYIHGQPRIFLESLKENRTISVLDLELQYYDNTLEYLETLAEILKESPTIHTVRLHHKNNLGTVSQALIEAFITNKTFKELDLSDCLLKCNLEVLVDAMKDPNFSNKILILSPERELGLLDKAIPHMEDLRPYWQELMKRIMTKAQEDPQSSFKLAIKKGLKTIALEIFKMSKVTKLEIFWDLSSKSKDVLIEILKTDNSLQAIDIDDYDYRIFLALLPLKDSLSDGVKNWIDGTWDSLMKDPAKSVLNAFRDNNTEIVKEIMKKVNIKTSLSE